MRLFRKEEGQAIIIVVVAMTALLGMSALVLDVGTWYVTQRHLQAKADAAALAGAQVLPAHSDEAYATAEDYAARNNDISAATEISFDTRFMVNDTISVSETAPAPGIFAHVFGIDTVTVRGRATARAQQPEEVLHLAPMVVSEQHPLLAGPGCPCFGQVTHLNYDPMGAPGAFGMLNLENDGGTVGTTEEAAWISEGFSVYLGLGWYRSDPGAKFSSNVVQDALTSRIGTVLLFPVFRVLQGGGQNAEYQIIGWVGFLLESFDAHGNNATLHGTFTEFIADGITSDHNPNQPYFGVRSISLVN
jgi:Flp pilus assembly protein TadG